MERALDFFSFFFFFFSFLFFLKSMQKELNIKGGKNTFKFLSFNDQIEQVKIKTFSLEKDSPCFFLSELLDLKELVLTTPMQNAYSDISKLEAESLPEIVYKKSQLVLVLLTHLKTAPELISLVTALCKDLIIDSLDYLDFLSIFVELIPSLDPKMIKIYFENITINFKILKLDTVKVIKIVKNLLGNRVFQPFVSQAVAFLMRKDKVMETAIEYVVQESIIDEDVVHEEEVEDFECKDKDANSIYSESMSLILFETVKQLNGLLYSKAPRIITLIIQKSFQKNVFKMLEKLFILLGNHTQNLNELFETLKKSYSQNTNLILKLMTIFTSIKNGQQIGIYN
jgi:hypothetical protein